MGVHFLAFPGLQKQPAPWLWVFLTLESLVSHPVTLPHPWAHEDLCVYVESSLSLQRPCGAVRRHAGHWAVTSASAGGHSARWRVT